MILTRVTERREREGVENLLDPFAALDAAEEDEPRGVRPLPTEARVARIVGARCWREQAVFLDPETMEAAKFWLVFDRPRLVCDALPKGTGEKVTERRRRLARKHGYRYVAFGDGQTVTEKDILRAAGRE